MSPRRLRTPCAEPGCPAITDGGRCPRHQKPAPPRQTPRPHYGPGWQTIRRQVLAEQPVCRCGAPATQVHHLVGLGQGGTNDRANLVGLCRSCHSSAGAKSGERWRRRVR